MSEIITTTIKVKVGTNVSTLPVLAIGELALVDNDKTPSLWIGTSAGNVKVDLIIDSK